MKVIQIAKAKSESRDNPNQYRVYDTKGIAPCLNSMGGGGLEPHIAMKVKNATKEGSIEIRVGGDEYSVSTERHKTGACY